jgi:hypothetical protein
VVPLVSAILRCKSLNVMMEAGGRSKHGVSLHAPCLPMLVTYKNRTDP